MILPLNEKKETLAKIFKENFCRNLDKESKSILEPSDELVDNFLQELVNDIFQKSHSQGEGKEITGNDNESFGQEILSFLLGLIAKEKSKETIFKTKNTKSKEKIVLQSKEEVISLLKNLKKDAIIFSGSKNGSLGVVIQNATNSQLSHCQYLRYLGENKRNNGTIPQEYQIIEAAMSYDCNGVSKNPALPKIFKDSEAKDWFYICPIDWRKFNGKVFKKRVYQWIDNLKNDFIAYDVVNLFQDSFGIRMNKYLNTLKNGSKINESLSKNIDSLFNSTKYVQVQDSKDADNLVINLLKEKLIEFISTMKNLVEQNNDFESMVCSEFIGFLFRLGKVIPQDHNVSIMTPQDNVELKIFEDKYYVFGYDKSNGKGRFCTDDLMNFNSEDKYLKPPKKTKTSCCNIL